MASQTSVRRTDDSPPTAADARNAAPGLARARLARGPRLALALLLLTGVAQAQLHKDTRRGFQFKPPKDYNSVALNPAEFITIAKYQSDRTDYSGQMAHFALFSVHYFPGDGGDAQIETAWSTVETIVGYHSVDKSKKLKVAKAQGEERYLIPDGDGPSVHYYAAVLPQDDGVYVFVGEALDSRFDKRVKDYAKAVKSFKRIAKDDADEREAERSQMSDQERFLATQIEKLPPGWDSLRTERYLFLFNADKDFVKEMAERIESMRDIYEDFYPPDRDIEAISIVRVCNSREEYMGYGGSPGSGGYWASAHRELVFFDQRPRTSTMAVLNHEAFHQYIYYFYGELSPHSWYNEGHGDYFAGASMTSSHRVKKYADPPGGIGRRMTVKEAARLRKQGTPVDEGAATALVDLMRYSQGLYYGRSGPDSGTRRGLIHYAQGWALVHMLREHKGLEPAWERILPEYLDNLLEARAEVADELMVEALELAEKKEKGSSAEISRDPQDYYTAASLARGNDIQDLAYEKTFEGWTEDDWAEFDEFYLNYVEKL